MNRRTMITGSLAALAAAAGAVLGVAATPGPESATAKVLMANAPGVYPQGFWIRRHAATQAQALAEAKATARRYIAAHPGSFIAGTVPFR